MSGDGDHVIAKADYDFQGAGNEELTFQAGDRIILAPRGQNPEYYGIIQSTKDFLIYIHEIAQIKSFI